MAQQTPTEEGRVATDVARTLPVVAESTTSRVLVNNPLLRVVHFTFDAGELLTEHASPRAVVVTLLEGAITFRVDGVDHELAPGDVVYLAPGQRHALTATQPSRLQLVMIDVD